MDADVLVYALTNVARELDEETRERQALRPYEQASPPRILDEDGVRDMIADVLQRLANEIPR